MESYKFDKYINYLLNEMPFIIPKRRDFPHYNKIIKEYGDILRTSSHDMPRVIGSRQIYTIPFDLNGGDFFELHLDVVRLTQSVACHGDEEIKTCRNYNPLFQSELNLGSGLVKQDLWELNFNLDTLVKKIDPSTLDKKYACIAKNNNDPIICLDFNNFYKSELPFAVADGNHRVYGKYLAGEKMIKGYLLSQNIWINALYSPLDEVFVKVACNIHAITNYMLSIFDLNQAQSKMYSINNAA